jgi:hypothetical protein
MEKPGPDIYSIHRCKLLTRLLGGKNTGDIDDMPKRGDQPCNEEIQRFGRSSRIGKPDGTALENAMF